MVIYKYWKEMQIPTTNKHFLLLPNRNPIKERPTYKNQNNNKNIHPQDKKAIKNFLSVKRYFYYIVFEILNGIKLSKKKKVENK